MTSLGFVYHGFGSFLKNFAGFKGVNDKTQIIKLGHTVTNVSYNETGVKVSYYLGDDERNREYITGDCVVCTVPLGVLKKDAIRFDPPLPKAKRDVIRDMGFGNVNKVVLVFEKSFWNLKQNYFGHLNEMSKPRGENFLFMSVGNLPILTAFMSGKAAEMNQADLVIVMKAMRVLRGIFGKDRCPQRPVESRVTRWHTDKYFLGSTSHIPPGFTGKIYDEMAEAVRARAEDDSYTGTPRVFFAGEHTYRADPGTVQGAWMSGMRAAAEVANEFLGMPFAAKNRKGVEYVDLVDDDDEDDIQILEEPMNTFPSDDEFDMDDEPDPSGRPRGLFPGPSQPGPSSQMPGPSSQPTLAPLIDSDIEMLSD